MNFSRISKAKLRAGVFDGPQIGELTKDEVLLQAWMQ